MPSAMGSTKTASVRFEKLQNLYIWKVEDKKFRLALLCLHSTEVQEETDQLYEQNFDRLPSLVKY